MATKGMCWYIQVSCRDVVRTVFRGEGIITVCNSCTSHACYRLLPIRFSSSRPPGLTNVPTVLLFSLNDVFKSAFCRKFSIAHVIQVQSGAVFFLALLQLVIFTSLWFLLQLAFDFICRLIVCFRWIFCLNNSQRLPPIFQSLSLLKNWFFFISTIFWISFFLFIRFFCK